MEMVVYLSRVRSTQMALVGSTLATLEYVDADGDGFPEEDDCDDGNPAINPSAEEVCDGADNDCDGTVDVDATDGITV